MDTRKVKHGFGNLLYGVQTRLRALLLVFLIGSVSGILTLRTVIWPFFEKVMRSELSQSSSEEVSIIVQTPFDIFLVQLKVGLIIGILLTLPIFAYILYKDVLGRSGIDVSKVPKSVLLLVGTSGMLLFISGLAYSYRVFFPLVFDFLVTITVESGFEPTYAISEWTQFMLILSISFGLVGQITLFLPVLVRYKVLEYNTVKEGWRYWVVITLSLGAVLSPPEPVSQLLWASPLILLYIGSIGVSKIVNPVDIETKEDDDSTQEYEQQGKNDSGEFRINTNSFDFQEDWVASYAKDTKIILSSIQGNIKLIGLFFLISMFASFYVLYDFGMEFILNILQKNLQNPESVDVIALHPVELLIFEAKLSVIIGITSTIPICLWRIWPDIRNKEVVSFGRSKGMTYMSLIMGTFILGCIIGFLYVAPEGLNLLSLDAERIDAIVSYRINSFFWISFYASISVGFMMLAYIIPLLGYIKSGRKNILVDRWRVVLFALLIISIMITPSSVLRAMVFYIPVCIIYAIGLISVRLVKFLTNI